MGQGIRMACLQGVQRATLRASISGNSITGNLAGLLAATNGSSDNAITVDSKSNAYSGNGVGCVLVAGISGGKPANDNSLSFESQNDEFSGNSLPTTKYATPGAGIAASAADSIATSPGRTNRNSCSVNLRNARCTPHNPAGDLVLVGAHGADGHLAGTDNVVVARLLGSTRSLVIPGPVSSDPYDPSNLAILVPHPGR
jgi:hypothetical protein